MLEAVAEFDDQVMEKYLNGQSLTEEEIRRAIRAGAITMKITPVLCGSAFKNKGVQQLLDGVVDFLPSPVDIPPVKGIDPNTGKEVEREAVRYRAVFCARLQDHDRSVCRPADLFPCVFRARSRPERPVLNVTKGTKDRIGRLLKMHANKREEIDAALCR